MEIISAQYENLKSCMCLTIFAVILHVIHLYLILNAYVIFEKEERYHLGGVALFIAKHCLNNDVELAILAKFKIIL